MKKTLLSCLALVSMLFAGSLQGYALEQDGQGVYQIATIDDLLDFADLVNVDGQKSIDGVLTADIDVAGELYTPIGNTTYPYSGTFDGQGHYINNLYIDSSELGIEEYLGAFGVLADGAHIKNLFIGGGDDAFIGGTRFCAGIAGGTNGKGKVTIENCGNEAWIYVTEENAAGILGVDMSSAADVTILNCYNTGTIQGGRECAAICGWIGDRGVCKGCWNTYDFEGGNGCDTGRPFCRYNGCDFEGNWDIQGKQTDAGISVISEADLAGLATGEFCFRVLNQTSSEDVAWFQTIGTDEHPFPIASHGTVYVVGDMNCDGTSKGGATTYSNNPSGNRDAHDFANGHCTKCDEFDPSYMTPDSDGFVELASDDDFYWFARLVNQKGNNSVSARLTADINYTRQVRLGDTYNFMGTLDGQNHKVTFNFSGDADKLAFIKNMENATVKDLLLVGEITSSTHFSAGVVSEAYGTSFITNVVADVDITSSYDGDGTHGGIIAVGHGDLTIENCAYVGTLTCPTSYGTGGIMGWSGDGQKSIIKNCYVGGTLDMMTGQNNIIIGRNNPYIENCWVSNNNEGLYDSNNFTTFFDVETLSTGEFCYKDLNGTETVNVAWFQTLGTDTYPVPFADHGIVYAAGAQSCDGTPKGGAGSFSNDPSGDRDPHSFANGFCTECHAVDPSFMTAGADGYFAISNSNELEWFAAYTKTQDTKNANAKLTADITYEAQASIGVVRCNYGGTFDGQGHTVTLALVRSEEEGRAGLFDMVEGATIKNLIIDGTIQNEGQFAAGLVVEAYAGTTVKNVVVKAEITSSYDGDGTHGGIVAIGYGDLVIENCAFVGTLEAELSKGTGGIMGYTHGGSKTTIKNSYVAGELILLEGEDNITISRNNPTVENCWASWDVSYYNNNEGVEFFETDGEMASGELCYNLGNKAWFQTINKDAYPVPFAEGHQTVYAHGDIDCSGKGTLTYDNVEGAPNYASHKFVDGECSACHNAYQISDAEGLIDFSLAVQAGEKTTAYVELAADIDLADTEFIPVGGRTDESGTPFQGTFDGKGHTVNLALSGGNNQALIGVVADGAVVKNVVVTGSVDGNGYCAGIVAATTGGGTLVIENCGNEANISVVEANAAGILGVDDLGGMKVVIKNCYNTGSIYGGRESAAISGWLKASSVVENTWNSGSVNGLDGTNTFARSQDGAAKYVNCYETIGTQVTATTDAAVKSGELCYNLNGGETKDVVWYQTIGSDNHPVFDATHGIVVLEGGVYKNIGGGVRGDANNDGNVTMADANLVVNAYTTGDTSKLNEQNADVTNDGNITMADANGIVNIYVGGDK